MLAAKYRLHKDVDIERVLRKKRGVFDVMCGIKYAKNDLPNSRFTVVAGTKVSKKAVDRNKMKRQYREILRALLPRITPGYDVMLLIGKAALPVPYEEKERQLARVFSKAGLLAHRAPAKTGHVANRPVPAHPVT